MRLCVVTNVNLQTITIDLVYLKRFNKNDLPLASVVPVVVYNIHGEITSLDFYSRFKLQVLSFIRLFPLSLRSLDPYVTILFITSLSSHTSILSFSF